MHSNSHLNNQITHSTLLLNNKLHVIGVIQNAVRYHSRYRLFRQWVKEMLGNPNVVLHVVEATYGDRAPECAPNADTGDYSYMQVKTDSEIWLKENLINIGVKNLFPRDWKYMAWVDCDVSFRNPDWAQATLHQLQHYNILQPWSDLVDLDYHGGIFGHFKSFGYLCANGKKKWHGKGKDGYTYAHTGMAWACTRYFYENVEKLLDVCIVGAGDHHMAWGCVGNIRDTIHSGMPEEYYRHCEDWMRKAEKACAGIVGYVHGRIEHHFHGPKDRRNYWGRWDIVTSNKLNPETDLAYDSQGVLILCGANKYQIEHQVMTYNRNRLEDSIEQY